MHETARSTPVDIDRLLDAAPWNAYQKSVVAIVALALLFDGLDSQVLGLAIPSILADWQVTRADLAPVVAAGLLGMGVGTALGGWAADRIGRKWSLIVSVALFGAATAISATVDSVGALGWMRAIAGIGLGGALPTATAMIAEYTPTKHRSVGIAVGMVTIPVGSMIGGLVSAAIIEDFGWQALFILGGILPLGLALGLIWALPESPRYLIHRPKRREELRRLLAKSGCGVASDARFVLEPSETAARTPLSAIFGADIRADTLFCWLAFFLTMLSLYTVVSWGPAMLASEGYALSFTGSALAGFAFGGIVGGLGSGWLLRQFGSRTAQTMLSAAGVLMGLVFAALFVGAAPQTTVALAAFAVLGVTITGMQNSLYVLGAHIYSTRARGTGVGVALTVGRLGAVASAFTGAISLDLGGGALFFVVIAFCLGLSGIAAVVVSRPVQAVSS
jgi:AAHS family 4-hydroxybenzoate transporter-like MFS transporter